MGNWIKFALKLCAQSNHSKHKMASVIIRGGQVLSAEVNLSGKNRGWGRCAEARCIRPHHCYEGTTIIIMRANGGCSKPCPSCMAKIVASGIKNIVFTNQDREIEKIKL